MSLNTLSPTIRPRRLRHHPSIRKLVQETGLQINDLVLPLFIRHGSDIKKPISSMPGHFQISKDRLEDEIQAITATGINSVILFGIPEQKDAFGESACSDKGTIQTAIPIIKKIAPQLLVISDLCFCEYTDHGHCGMITHGTGQPDVDNDKTLLLLARQAVSHAKAGADIIAPSGMMDGMVQAVRSGLDQAGFQHLPILSYSAKYASSLYGPFRDAAEGTPQFGDRKTYQMDYANANEAIRECRLDVAEGADMLMVKPAHTYLDIIAHIKHAWPDMPLGAYHTSGEFAMIKAAAKNHWVDERNAVLEILTSIRRAGADFIITYYAKEAAAWLSEQALSCQRFK